MIGVSLRFFRRLQSSTLAEPGNSGLPLRFAAGSQESGAPVAGRLSQGRIPWISNLLL